MSGKAIIWDFDGTLVLPKGLWSGTMMAALDTLISDHNMIVECLKPYLHTGFPWHDAEKAHPELSYPGAWWNRMEGYLKVVFEKVGFEEHTASALAQKTHEIYVDEKRYEVFPNTIETLGRLKKAGWQNVILSNHVPELPDIVDKPILMELIMQVSFLYFCIQHPRMKHSIIVRRLMKSKVK